MENLQNKTKVKLWIISLLFVGGVAMLERHIAPPKQMRDLASKQELKIKK